MEKEAITSKPNEIPKLKPTRRDILVAQIHQLKEAQKKRTFGDFLEGEETKNEQQLILEDDNDEIITLPEVKDDELEDNPYKQRKLLKNVNKICPYGTNCKFGVKCFYLHPENSTINNVNNNNNNNNNNDINNNLSQSTKIIPCRFGYSCKNRLSTCQFVHPTEKCIYGDQCKFKESCKFNHNNQCKFGVACKRALCSFSHYETDAQTETKVQSLSDSLPKTPPHD